MLMSCSDCSENVIKSGKALVASTLEAEQRVQDFGCTELRFLSRMRALWTAMFFSLKMVLDRSSQRMERPLSMAAPVVMGAPNRLASSGLPVCMRIGPRYQNSCAKLITADNKELQWVDEIRYLGIYLVSSFKFKCSFDNAKKSFYRSFNAVYGRVGGKASEEVVLALIKSKCLPVLLYGIDACPVNVSDSRSLDFTLTRILMKIFRTFSKEIIGECQEKFAVHSVKEQTNKRKTNFLRKYAATDNYICKIFSNCAEAELIELTVTFPT